MVESIQNHKVSELRSGQGNVNVSGVIKEMGELRSFNKYGKELRVANAIFEDSSGSIKLTLWNDDSTKFKQGDKVKIVNGYVSEFQGEKQLTSGKYGRIEKTDGSEEVSAATEELSGAEEAQDAPVEQEDY
jgi:replication factor A1